MEQENRSTKLTIDLKQNKDELDRRLKDCDDIKNRTMKLGGNAHIDGMVYYVEVAIDNISIEKSVIGQLISRLMGMDSQQMYKYLDENAMGITDVKQLTTIEEVIGGIMIGDTVLLIDGYDKAVKIKDKGYPSMGVSEAGNEKVLRGSKEGFGDSIKSNEALLRKRIRSESLKIKEKVIGEVTNTNIVIAYDNRLARPYVIQNIEEKLDKIKTEGVTDSGIIEQILEDDKLSPFPRYQTTERPDKAAMAVLEGRVVVMVDNSPMSLILPATFGSFMQTVDDYYENFLVASLARIIRYIAVFLSCSLPALYIVAVNFHPEILPTELTLMFAKARETVPFPSILEVMIMELSFELLREAGIRIPGPMGSTIGIVGGLIIGQAAVEAGIVSPIIVIVVATTALASFAIPVEEFAAALRVTKYFLILMAYILGFFGVICGWILLICHLSSIRSFGFPY